MVSDPQALELLDLLEATIYRLHDAGVSREDIEIAVDEAGGRHASQVEDDLEQVVVVVGFMDGCDDALRQDVEQGIQVVCDSELSHGSLT